MPVGKGFRRPQSWPPVGSIIQITQDVELGGDTVAEAGDWVIVHLTTGSIVLDDGTRYSVRLSMLHPNEAAAYQVFRHGRRDYSRAWHQPLPWMERM